MLSHFPPLLDVGIPFPLVNLSRESASLYPWTRVSPHLPFFIEEEHNDPSFDLCDFPDGIQCNDPFSLGCHQSRPSRPGFLPSHPSWEEFVLLTTGLTAAGLESLMFSLPFFPSLKIVASSLRQATERAPFLTDRVRSFFPKDD